MSGYLIREKSVFHISFLELTLVGIRQKMVMVGATNCLRPLFLCFIEILFSKLPSTNIAVGLIEEKKALGFVHIFEAGRSLVT